MSKTRKVARLKEEDQPRPSKLVLKKRKLKARILTRDLLREQNEGYDFYEDKTYYRMDD